MIHERRLRLPTGLEIEVDIGPLGWAAIEPLDDGTAGVARGGMRVIWDPDGRLARLLAAVAQRGHATDQPAGSSPSDDGSGAVSR